MSGFVFDEITTSTPEKSLLAPIKKKGGRNNMGRITVRHRVGDISVGTASSTFCGTKITFLQKSFLLNTIRTEPLG